MKKGKLTNQNLKKIVLDRLPPLSERVYKGPGAGLDCAILHSSNELISISSDPVTGASKNIGKIAIHVSCNDIACCGIRPEAVMLVVIMPSYANEDDLIHIIDEAAKTAKELHVDIIGGHTEISDAVNQFVLITTAFGFSKSKDMVNASGAKEGDTILITKYIAQEGTAIIAADYPDLLHDVLSTDEWTEARHLIEQISVVEEGVLCGMSKVHGMHDVTEGGVLGAAWELAEASNIGCEIHLSSVPLLPVTRKICQHLSLDPFRLISSGSMLITTDQPNEIIKVLSDNNIPCASIGKIVKNSRTFFDLQGEKHELTDPPTDELYKLSKKD